MVKKNVEQDIVDQRLAQWARVLPGLALDGLIGRMVRILHYHTQASTVLLQRYDLKPCEADVIWTLLHAGPPYELNPKDITRLSYRTPGAMTNRLDQLEKKGLVERAADADSRRRILVRLTETGRSVAYESFCEQTTMEKAFLGMLDDDAKEQLRGLLRRVVADLEEKRA